VTEWPRGLLDYVPTGPSDDTPSDDEDRTANRIRLAGRLLGVLAARGLEVAREVAELHAAERTFAAGDRPRAARQVDELLAALDRRAADAAPGGRDPPATP